MTSPTLFNNKSTAVALTGGAVSPLTSLLAGGSGGGSSRLSIRGGRFREIVDGVEQYVHETSSINVCVINAAPVSRTYYEGEFDENVKAAPLCWSSNGKTPDAGVHDEGRQSSRCDTCPKNIKGSGKGDSRACRFQQRVAVLIENETGELMDEVYQLALPATSLFGDADAKGNMGLQGYARFLQSHKTDISVIVTKLKFDPASSVPKLFFSAERPLTEDELQLVQEKANSEAAIKAITMTVSQADGVQHVAQPEPEKEPEPAPLFNKPPAAEKPAAEAPKRGRGRPKTAVGAAREAVAEPVPEPVKAAPAKTQSAPPSNLADIVGEWDDE